METFPCFTVCSSWDFQGGVGWALGCSGAFGAQAAACEHLPFSMGGNHVRVGCVFPLLWSPAPQADVPTTLTTHQILFWKATSKPKSVLSVHSLTFTLKPRVMLQFNRAQRARLSQDVLVSLGIFKASWKNPHHHPRGYHCSRANPLTWHSSKAMLEKYKITCENIKPPSFSARWLPYTQASTTANGLHHGSPRHHAASPGPWQDRSPIPWCSFFPESGDGFLMRFLPYFFIWRLTNKLFLLQPSHSSRENPPNKLQSHGHCIEEIITTNSFSSGE